MNSTSQQILSTPRLLLRQPALDDENEIYTLRNDEKVNEYLARPKTTTREEVINFIKKIIKGIENKDSFYWVITSKNDGKLVGTICYWNISKDRSTAEIGYELIPGFQGKGIMQEVFPAVLQYGFEILGFTTIEAYTHPNNDRSSKLLEKFLFKRKLGEEGMTENNEIVYVLAKQISEQQS